jgi:hypothetical protein
MKGSALPAIPDSHLMRDSDGVFDHAVASDRQRLAI